MRERFYTLDVLRGISILCVMFTHIHEATHRIYGDAVHHWIFLFGNWGVSVFLVISGYSICLALDRPSASNSPGQFLNKRLLRIYTPHWWALLCAAVIIPNLKPLASLLSGGTPAFKTLLPSAGEWVQFITLSQVFNSVNWDLANAFTPLWHLWYVAITAQIYIVVAVMLYLKLDFLKASTVLALLSFLSQVPFIKSLVPSGLFLPYWVQFYTGIVLFQVLNRAQIKDRLSSKSGVPAVSIACTLLFSLLYVFTVDKWGAGENWAACFASAFLIYTLHPWDKRLGQAGVFKVLSLIGIISYSLYLIHIPLLWLIIPRLPSLTWMPVFLTHFIAVTAIIVALGYLWFIFFEKPGTISGTARAFFHPFKSVYADVTGRVLWKLGG